MSVTRYSREVDLDDLNNVHTFAVLAVPPGSRVLDLGAADGSVARVLAERGCVVTAVERDGEGVAALAAAGIRAIQANLDTLADDDIPRRGYDVVLLLDVLEHLVDPARVLALTSTWLAPGGRVLLSVPHVGHAAVRLALLRGRFPRTDVGLLDRTHLQFFDLAHLDALVRGAGLRALDMLTVERGVDDTELGDVGADAPPDVLRAMAADPLSRVYQFFIVASPGDGAGASGGLMQAWQKRLRAIEHAYHALEDYAAHVESEAQARGDGRRAAAAASTETATHEVAVAPPRLADVVADRDVLRRQLSERMAELEHSTDTIAVLLREVAVQREFAESLAAQMPRIAARGGEAQVLDELERYRLVAPTPAEAAGLVGQAAEFRRLQSALAFRALARLDAWSRRMPRLRSALRAIARGVAG
jgi:2-polyprenyl-3-methyl-5-hydroxy-6-metoxy-1,4-benzoquinol methylase